ARNLYKVDVRDVAGIDPVSLIAFDKVVILLTLSAIVNLPSGSNAPFPHQIDGLAAR
ncbi:hypothetical protein ACJ8PF_08220, partial [Serratia sp. CY81166]